MNIPLTRPATEDGLFLWIMHCFAASFDHHAVLKGGMALRLIDSPRSTTDIDYVFVPYESKSEVRSKIEEVLANLPDATIEITLNSRMLRAEIHLDDASIQLEVQVATECPGIPMSTGGFAQSQNQPARVVSIMSFDWAFAHKLAAWNERRLLRDLYDCYFFFARLGERPNVEVLSQRLAKMESMLPQWKTKTCMSYAELAEQLALAASALSSATIAEQLGGLLPPEEIAGLDLRMRAAIHKLVDWLKEKAA